MGYRVTLEVMSDKSCMGLGVYGADEDRSEDVIHKLSGRKEQMTMDEKLKMRLQFFAEGEESGKGAEQAGAEGSNDGSNTEQPGDGQNAGEGSYSQSEVDRRISKAVESALEKQKARLEEQKQEEIEQAKKKAQEYSQLTERERIEKELEEREERLTAKERELKLATLKTDVENDLKENGLPTAFSSVLIKEENPEEIKKVVKSIKAEFDEAIKRSVEDRLKQDPPKDGHKFASNRSDKETIAEKARKSRIIKN